MVLTRRSVRKLETPNICWALKTSPASVFPEVHPSWRGGCETNSSEAKQLKVNRVWIKEIFYWVQKSLKAAQNNCGPMRNRLFSRASLLLIQLVQSQPFLGQCLWVCEEPTWRTKFPKMLQTLKAASQGKLGIWEGIKSTLSTIFHWVFYSDSIKN